MKREHSHRTFEHFRRALAAERNRLLELLPVPGEHQMEIVSADEWAPAAHDEFVASRLDALEAGQLRDVEEALQRIAGGTFGVCQGCGRRIPRRRLSAVPWTAFCFECQSTALPPAPNASISLSA
ncbi:MAG: TraR/DksA C4-type zinc finger protein [Bryobacteraceae bacterium]